MNNTKSNFGKWGWAMIIYCAISYYMAAVLSTDTLNWYPSAFASLRGWGEGFVNLCNAMAGLGGWIGVAAAIIFSIMAAKKGSRFMAVFGNVICGISLYYLCYNQKYGGISCYRCMSDICIRKYPAERCNQTTL